MRLAVRLALRGLRGSGRHLGPFVACLALGVGAVTAVGTFGTNVERGLGREARTLSGGDVELRAAQALPAAGRAAVDDLAARGARISEVRELVTMARAPVGGRSMLVEVKAVDARYPLYGSVETSPRAPLADLLAGDGAVVAPELLARLGIAVGEHVDVGDARFVVRGTLDRAPDRVGSAVTLGPRVLIAADALARTGLVQVGSRVTYRTLVRLPAGADAHAARDALRARLPDPAVRVVAFDEARPGLRRLFAQLTTYLGLVGLASLLVGAVGAAASIGALVKRELPTVAILEVLGAGARLLLAVALVRTLVLALVAGVVGVGLGVALQPLLVRFLGGLLPVAVDWRPDPWTLLRAVGMGALAAVLATLWPLAEIRAVRPSRILRRDVDPPAPPRPPLTVALVLVGVATLALWQAGSAKLGVLFLGAALAAVILLATLARALVRLARAVPRPPGPAWRQGVAGLRRPGGHTTLVVVALGLGVMLLVAVGQLERSLDREMDYDRRAEAPSFFFIDVQPDQRDGFARLVASANGGRPPTLTPLVRARLARVKDEAVTRAMIDRRRAAQREEPWYFTRDYMLTSAADLPPGNVVVRGRWWTGATAAGRALVSLEDGAARNLGVDVGDRLTFDVQGVAIDAEVASIRKVDWQSLTTNFFVIFAPGPLEGAPTTYVATVRVPAARERGLQDQVVAAFPNVTAIPVRDVLERVAALVGHLALAIRAIGLFTVLAGLVVLAAVLGATRAQRLYESVVLRALGATRGVVARAFAVEYACLGAAAGLGGTILAVVLAWVVLRFVLDVPWTFEPAALVLGVAVTVLVSVAVGFLATFRVLGEKPLAVLRRE